ncbi:MAG: DUF3160 domain-containing protein, partial [Chloroflexota bacterium]|nr:DUF3160 domain-containing protein [Chloroflexota bacterium]
NIDLVRSRMEPAPDAGAVNPTEAPFPVEPPGGLEPTHQPAAVPSGITSPDRDSPAFVLPDARFFSLIDETFALTRAESDLLQGSGCLVSDRLAFQDFSTAYTYLHWKDLPVLITTDSLLHAIHQSYADLLIDVESHILYYKLQTLLRHTLAQVQRAADANRDPLLAPLYADLATYLGVPLALLDAEGYGGGNAPAPTVSPYLALVHAANTAAEVDLFSAARTIDFTLFQPRGHYTYTPYDVPEDLAANSGDGFAYPEPRLKCYFRAMTWLAQVDFRLVDYTPAGEPRLQLEPLAAAILLRDAIAAAGVRGDYQEIDALVSAFVGRSDNTTLADLERFLADADLHTPGDVLRGGDGARWLALLTSGAYGQQRITGQWLSASKATPDPVPRPISFLLLGMRFVEDSFITSALVYDRLLVHGHKVERALPSPLDVWAVLGNERALGHLEDELARYGYHETLARLRQEVAQLQPAFWEATLYHRFLYMVRMLAVDTSGPAYPTALRSAAWADKMLHTQLGAWTQLRHDTILYAKQSVTSIPVCEYPAGYVEPYPAFYAAVEDYATMGRELLGALATMHSGQMDERVRQQAVDYFEHLGTVARQLRGIAEKELRQERLSSEEEMFLKETASRHVHWAFGSGCSGPIAVEQWSGWYPRLMPWRESNPALIADIHTNPSGDLDHGRYPPCVLHAATGPVAVALLLVDTQSGTTIYACPAYTYYEVVEAGPPLVRLTDAAWRAHLASQPRPAAPQWTASFRVPSWEQPEERALPMPEPPPPRPSARSARWSGGRD